MKNHSAAKIHCEFHVINGTNSMSEGKLCQWLQFFKNEKTNIHNEERSGRSSLVGDDLLNKANEKICENHHFTISELSDHFPEISWGPLPKIITEKPGYHKFCAH